MADNPKPPPGRRGRPPGRRNKATVLAEKRALAGLEEAAVTGMSPLDVMLLGVAHPERVSDKRFNRAKEAAPYMHPKLTAVAFKDLTPPTDLIDLSKATPAELAVLRKYVAKATLSIDHDQASEDTNQKGEVDDTD